MVSGASRWVILSLRDLVTCMGEHIAAVVAVFWMSAMWETVVGAVYDDSRQYVCMEYLSDGVSV